MLVGLGFNPLYAAGICLIANTAPVAFGSLGIPIVTAGVVTGLSDLHISAIAGRQLPVLSIIVPLWLSVTMCGFKRSMEVMPAILVAGACFATTQFLASNYHGPWLPDILSAIATIVGLIILLRVWKPTNTWHFPDEPPVTKTVHNYTAVEILRAWSPYLILAAMVLVWGLPAFKTLVLPTQTIVPWPGLHNLIIKAAPIVTKNAPYAATYTINPVTAAGTAVLISGILATLLTPNYSLGRAAACFVRTTVQLRFPILTIAMMLALAYIMNYSGMSSTLGLAFTNTGWLFPFFAPILGWLGVFLTGSDTSSNALFGNLQKTAAEQLQLSPELMIASNSTGGVTGKMISPQSIAVATAATNMIGQEGNLFRFTLLHSMAMLVVLCVIAYAQAYWLSWMLPKARFSGSFTSRTRGIPGFFC
jgi:lactate permease